MGCLQLFVGEGLCKHVYAAVACGGGNPVETVLLLGSWMTCVLMGCGLWLQAHAEKKMIKKKLGRHNNSSYKNLLYCSTAGTSTCRLAGGRTHISPYTNDYSSSCFLVNCLINLKFRICKLMLRTQPYVWKLQHLAGLQCLPCLLQVEVCAYCAHTMYFNCVVLGAS